MLEYIDAYLQEVKQFQSSNKDEIEQFRIKFNGKKGILNAIFDEFKQVPNEQKKAFGQKINVLKQAVAEKLEELKNATASSIVVEKEDLTRPGYPLELGSRHPINLVKNRIIEIFKSIGFAVSDGPEIEDDWHNFTALNLPEYHPARDMQDTFFIEQNPDTLLRTHTSSVQIRHMEQNQPPMRILSPGRVFRNEAISSRSHCIFHQIEGLYIDEKVSFADLKQTIQFFTTELFGKSKIRMRPSYFPFTEPSAEVDVYWGLNSETDYRITKGTGWLEIMGCGMVDPAVLKNVNINPDKYSGYAFGMGIERIVMLLYQMSDIRMFFENDVRMLEQFKTL
ncbi:phenylalanine--tRNA ligase subunit alpha [Riemerella anatipestifer]|uniref:Phenylalanine--tRNA ligase alpha subunit n=1 Tax=Riemerella anatipestifer (strain ATCC 11845 / DSM 15868 / JCM 9532 / NCTC 11014) TaxID=693978 RepID=E4TDD3_RIEAD|nr:phenylalanine--tRNA ligase subunit alpha [Riemerella anatipestifer]ADQ82792.1 phenylalanyl-tRNA synthetase, alpha subunit [Riemerella anatipestifer ATCC 11845 = DSM 15868]AFD56802.1 phenylalanyl-tRNA synthetase, alpha subunit [Riemerella anatipestifer ATCC 11845 = DSM 15868]MDD1524947.1 phenylalanine--tRNA ligase subunit alpha [Riemerella anatipestifer]MDY3529779.1 phenylalanine--tRNA ligase subunit alpha [Riemerella anatipestifer]MRM92370.1 phenylalanine--tRNA ligase subunit alpha [Riemere